MNYLVYKKMQILFNSNQKEEIRKMDIYSDSFLNDLNVFIQLNMLTGFINYEIRENMYDLISEIRFNYKYETYKRKVERYEIYNNMISNLNQVNTRIRHEFYNSELYKRYFDIGDDYSDFTEDMIALDYEILCNLANSVNNGTLSEIKLSQYVMNNDFICSINAILFENPQILRQDEFKNNLINILNENLYVCEIRKKENKRYSQFIKIRTQFLIQRINELNEKKYIKKIR